MPMKNIGWPCHGLSVREAMRLLVIVAVAPALAMIAWTGIEHGKLGGDLAIRETRRQADAFAELQTLVAATTKQLLATLVSLPAFRSGDTDAMSDILKAVHRENPDYLNLSVVDLDDKVIASSLLQPGTVLGDRSHFIAAKRDGVFSTGEYTIGRIDDVPSFPYAQPIRDDGGQVIALVSAIYKLVSYNALFDHLAETPGSFLGLVDRNGVRLYFHPAKHTNPIGEPIKVDIWERLRSGGDEGQFIDIGSDGIKRFYGYRSLYLEDGRNPYMYIVYASPVAAAYAASRSILIRDIIIMLVVALAALASAEALYGRFFGRRINRIIAATAHIRDGEFGARVTPVDTSPELGAIGQAINLMAEALENRDVERKTAAAQLSAALDEKETLLKELHHRVKNNMQMILGMVQLQTENDGGAAAFKAAMENRIAAMALVHELLYETENHGDVALAEQLQRLVDLLVVSVSGAGDVAVTVRSADIRVGIDKAVPFSLLVNELVVNAFKHGLRTESPQLVVSLETGLAAGKALCRLTIADNGPGLPADFVLANAKGLGLHLADALTKQLGGTLAWANKGGAVFTAEFSIGARSAS